MRNPYEAKLVGGRVKATIILENLDDGSVAEFTIPESPMSDVDYRQEFDEFYSDGLIDPVAYRTRDTELVFTFKPKILKNIAYTVKVTDTLKNRFEKAEDKIEFLRGLSQEEFDILKA